MAVKVFGGSDGQITRTVRNSGATAVTLSRSSSTASGGGYKLAAAAELRVTLDAGETLWGICAAASETTLEIA